MSEQNEVLADLERANGNKSKLMQQYSDRQQQIVKQHGGSVSDVPVNNPDHEYYQLQTKMQILGKM